MEDDQNIEQVEVPEVQVETPVVEDVQVEAPPAVDSARYEHTLKQRDEFATRASEAEQRAAATQRQLDAIKQGKQDEEDPDGAPMRETQRRLDAFEAREQHREHQARVGWLRSQTTAACAKFPNVTPSDVYAHIAALPDAEANKADPWKLAEKLHNRIQSQFAPVLTERDAIKAERDAFKAELEALKAAGGTVAPVTTAPAGKAAPHGLPPRPQNKGGQVQPQTSSQHDRRTSQGRAAGFQEALDRLQ